MDALLSYLFTERTPLLNSVHEVTLAVTPGLCFVRVFFSF